MKGDKNMKKTLLFHTEDWHEPLKNEDIISYFDITYKVINENYQNKFGTFILLEATKPLSQEELAHWKMEKGADPHPDRPYELVKTISIPYFSNQLTPVGYLIRNRTTQETKGYTFRQAWALIHKKGTTNAQAIVSQRAQFTSHLIDTIDELPSADSLYWKVPAYNDRGLPYAAYTDELEWELNRTAKSIARIRLSSRIRKVKQSLSSPFSINKETSRLKKWMSEANHLTVLTGAGISTLSGIPDFRSFSNGIWTSQPNLLTKLNQETFNQDPKLFWTYYKLLINAIFKDIVPFQNHPPSLMAAINCLLPNIGHYLFTSLESRGKDVTIITQNVDRLHQKAGSKQVHEVHGNFFQYTCPTCSRVYGLEYIINSKFPTCNDCKSIIRPNLVFFGDSLQNYEKALQTLKQTDLFIVMGTSLEVSPVNQIPFIIKETTTAKTAIINGTPTPIDSHFDIVINGNIEEICTMLQANKK